MSNLAKVVGGKAQNLTILSSIAGITVPRFMVLPASLLRNECEERIKCFLQNYSGKIAVRSSGVLEDSSSASFAGMYLTKLSVNASVDAVMGAVEEVRKSGKLKEETAQSYAALQNIALSGHDIAVVVQEMIHPDLSGVIFSHGLAAQDGYYSISVVDGLGEAVVDGSVNGRLFRVARGLAIEDLKEDWLAQLVSAMREIECHYGSDNLDVEFAFQNGKLSILQCRPISVLGVTRIDTVDESKLVEQLKAVGQKVAADFSDDVLGDMIDINPLELLGTNPSRLDISIFGHLFADTVVERVRRTMGYDPLDIGLIRVVGEKPYVSLLASAFSFRPQGVSTETYKRMVGVYRRMLTANPNLQSRVEFAVYAMSCGQKLDQVMRDASIAEEEQAKVRMAFERLSVAINAMSQASFVSFSGELSAYQEQIDALPDDTSLDLLLSHVAKGTEMFVRVARLAFYWKNKFEETYPAEDLNKLLVGRVHSSASRMKADIHAVQQGQLSRAALVSRYGHLRPGQFSVFGESYADDPGHYLFSQRMNPQDHDNVARPHKYENEDAFKNFALFMQAREDTKFAFSRALHLFIEKLKAVLLQHGVSSSQAADCRWDDLRGALERGEMVPQAATTHLPMILPEVIIPQHTTLGVVAYGEAAPTFITDKVIKANVCVLARPQRDAKVEGALVLIPSADPGYDFLFHSGVVGIITKSGGPASHMCIRAIELQMPSCIGCGESVFNAVANARVVVLDCSLKQILASA